MTNPSARSGGPLYPEGMSRTCVVAPFFRILWVLRAPRLTCSHGYLGWRVACRDMDPSKSPGLVRGLFRIRTPSCRLPALVGGDQEPRREPMYPYLAHRTLPGNAPQTVAEYLCTVPTVPERPHPLGCASLSSFESASGLLAGWWLASAPHLKIRRLAWLPRSLTSPTICPY